MATTSNSFMKSIFSGELREDLLFPYPEMKAEVAESVRMILDSIDRFAADQVRSAEWDEKGEMPREIVTQMAELGMMGLAVPEEFGGLALPQSGYARIMQQVASIDGSLAVTLGAHQSIGYKAILLFGTDEQKRRFLPRLASGELIAAYCLTEPSSGSDAASIRTQAVLSDDGRHYILTGNKLWITNGGIASFFTVFAKTEVDDGKGGKKEKVTAFAVELPAEGVTVGPAEHKLGIRASWTNAVHFDKVKVPVENVIGEAGKGFKVAMGVLNHGRMGLAAGCVGGSKEALKAAIAHANEREQFQKKLIEFGMVQEKISRLATNIFAGESLVQVTTALMDRGDVDYSLESAIAKVFNSELYWEACDENLQIWAGSGYMKEYPYERWLRDARINRIFEGTNEILRAFIALSGMQGPAKELAGLVEAIKYPLKGLGPVSDFAMRTIRQSVFGASLTQAHPKLENMAKLIESTTVELARAVVGLLRKHQKKIHLKQMSQKRIADIAIDTYAMACIVSRVTQALNRAEGDASKCELELALAENFYQMARRRIRGAFKALERGEDDSVQFIALKLGEKGSYPFDMLQ